MIIRCSGGALLLLSILVVFLAAGSAAANDSAYEGSGATVYQVKEERVRMVNETIDIRNAEEEMAPRRWRAECEFTFENLTDSSIEIQMGFPDWAIYDDGEGERIKAIRDFHVWIEGKEVTAEYKKVEQKKGKKAVTLPGGGKIPYSAAYVWSVHFEPHQKVVVKNTYCFGGFSTVVALWEQQRETIRFPTSMPRLTRADVFWTGKESPKERMNWDDAPYSLAIYIVTTGLTWSGPIGHAKISIDLPDNMLPNRAVPMPLGFRVENGRVVWEFSDWKPKSEIGLYVITPPGVDGLDQRVFGSAAEAKRWIAWAKKSRYDRETVRRLRNAYFALHGHDFDDPKLAAYFERLDYKKTPGRKVAMEELTADERAAVKALEEFEKSLPEKP